MEPHRHNDPLLGCLIEDITYIEACRAGPEKLRSQNKDWQKADELREKLRSLGVVIKDLK